MSTTACRVVLLFLFAILLPETAVADEITPEQWREDLAALDQAVRTVHKSPFHTVSEEDFSRMVDTLHERIPELSDQEIIVEMAAIVAAVNDGHTRLSGWHRNLEWGFNSYPIALYWFSDGLYVRQAHPDHRDLVGAKVLQIGEFDAEVALEKVGRVVAADNVHSRRGDSAFYLISPEVMQAVGILDADDSTPYVFEKDGREWSPELPVHDGEWPGWVRGFIASDEWIDAKDASGTPTALWRRHPEKTYWFEYLPEDRILYVQQNQIQHDPDERLEPFYARVWDALEQNDVDKLVLDVRLNGGGNNYLNRPPFTTMVRADPKVQTFVILGRDTFSACQNLVNEISRWTDTVFVGEPTAERVNFYGDTQSTELPNSGLVVRASWLWWQNLDPRDTRDALYPDIATDMSYADYAANRDPAMEAIRSYSGLPTAENMLELISDDGMPAVEDLLGDVAHDSRYRHLNVESQINELGYELLGRGRVDEAVAIFELNTKQFPDSWNVYDSLGDAYEAQGDLQMALESFRKSLSLRPDSPTGLEGVERIEAKLADES